MNIVMKLAKYSSIVLFFLFVLWIGKNHAEYDTEQLRDWIVSYGIFSPVIYLLACSIRPFIFFPFLILSITGGLAFGVIAGTVLTVTGSLVAAALSFGIIRKYGNRFSVQNWKKTQSLQSRIETNGFYYVLILRAMPFLNFDLVSYASGLSNVAFRSYLTGTLIGMLPGTIMLNYFGFSLTTGDSMQIGFGAILIIILSLLTFFIKSHLKKNRSHFDFDQ